MVRDLKGDEIPDVWVSPYHIHIGEIDGDITGSIALKFKPLGFDVRISISRIALYKLVKYAVKRGYILLNGEMYIKQRGRMERIRKSDESKEA